MILIACGQEEGPSATRVGISANVRQIDEGDQFAIIVSTDVPNRSGSDFVVPLIYENIDESLIDGSGVIPIIQEGQEFNSIILVVNDDPDSIGDRELVVRIDPNQVPSGLVVAVNSSVTVKINDN